MTAPLVVNTADGTCWTRREAARDGEPLYAMADCERCPELVMATYAELEEHGIVGSADVLPMPVGPKPQALSVEREQEIRSLDLLALVSDRAAPVVSGHLAALLAEVDELRAQRERRRLRLVALQNDALSMRGSLSPMGEDRKVPFPLGETLTPAVDWLIARIAELESERPVLVKALAMAADTLRANADRIAELEATVAPAADPCTCPPAAHPHQVGCPLDEVPASERPVNELTAVYMPVASYREDPHDSPLWHSYRVGHDLPETGGAL